MSAGHTAGPHYHKRNDFGELKAVTISVRRYRSGWAACETFETLEGTDKGATVTFNISRRLVAKRLAEEIARAAIAKATGKESA